MLKHEFSKFSLDKRAALLRQDGTHIGARELPSHFVHLYAFHGYFVEVFLLKTLNQIHWIEIQENRQILSEYTEKLDWKKDLGLDL